MYTKNQSEPKVLIAAVIDRYIPECLESFYRIEYTPLNYLFHRTGEIVGSSDYERNKKGYQIRNVAVTKARNALLEQAMKLRWDYILWLDADCKVLPNVVTKLLKYTESEKVITGWCTYRQGHTVLNCNVIYDGKHAIGCGWHVIMLAREVHKTIGQFIAEDIGEDWNYCHRMIAKGYKIFVARDVFVEHKHGELY